MKCWICEVREADSAEHSKKRSDIVREYGRGPYKGDRAPIFYRKGKFTDIQGPNSGLLKFGKSLCEQCNNANTQPFDLAYDHFVDWIVKNEATVMRRRFIDFADVYGENFESFQRNLFKYFVKVFGCALCEHGHVVPTDVVNLLREQYFTTALKISMAVNEVVASHPPDEQSGFFGESQIGINDDDPSFREFYWKRYFRWLTVFISYGAQTSGRLGSTWIANAQVVHLGSDETSPVDLFD